MNRKLANCWPAWMAVILTTAGCAHWGNGPGSPFAEPPKGSTLTLHRTLTIPPGEAGIYLQDGDTSTGAYDRFEPFCELHVWSFNDRTAQTIQPGAFTITRSRGNMRLVSQQPHKLAWAGSGNREMLRLATGDDAPSLTTLTVEMRLSSRRQPNVYQLECGGIEEEPALVLPPTLADIRRSLGSIMTLSLPGEAGNTTDR